MDRTYQKLMALPFALLTTLALLSGQAFAETFYISPQGSDDNPGLSTQPWASFEHAFTQLNAGDTLILQDGLYTESLNPSLSGEPGNPISFIAENDGQATIETTDEPAIQINNKNYLTIEGIFARTSGETITVYVGGHDGPDWSDKTTGIILRRVSAQGSSLLVNSSAFSVARANEVLLEDIWSFGHARNTLLVYGSENVTVRRAVIRWDGWYGYDYKPNDPRVSLSVYNTHNSLFENIIIIDGGEQGVDTLGERVALAVAGNNNGETAPFTASSYNRFFNIILLNNVGKGVNAESGGGTLLDNAFEHLVSWDNSQVGFNVNQDAIGTTLDHGTVGFNGPGVRFGDYADVYDSAMHSSLVMNNRKDEAIGSTSIGYRGNHEETTNDYNNVFDHDINYYNAEIGPNGLSEPITPEYLLQIPEGVNTGAARDGGDIGATIINMTVNGVETEEPLWPFPYEDRIKNEMCDPDALIELERSGDNAALWCESSQSLSEYVWEFLGNPIPDWVYDGPSPAPVDLAISDIKTIRGTVAGSFQNTHTRDDVHQSLTEEQSRGKPEKRYDAADHRWLFEVTDGNDVFNARAYRSDKADDLDTGFTFSWSVNPTGPWTELFTVTATTPTDYSTSLGASVPTMIYIRVVDNDKTRGNLNLSTLDIDQLFIDGGQL